MIDLLGRSDRRQGRPGGDGRPDDYATRQRYWFLLWRTSHTDTAKAAILGLIDVMRFGNGERAFW